MCLYVKDSKCPHGQAVKTSPSHGGIWGSIPHGGTKKSYTNVWDFLLPQGALCVSTHATMLHEPQNTGLAFHYVNKLTRSTITFTLFTTIPHGGTKNPTPMCGIFFYPKGALCISTHATLLHEPQNTGLALHYVSELNRFTITLTAFSTIPHGGVPIRT